MEVFLREYPEATRGALVCRTPRQMKLADRITALPWQEVSWVLDASVVVNSRFRNVPTTLGNDWPLRSLGNARAEQFFFAR